jgi:hypothetical protein
MVTRVIAVTRVTVARWIRRKPRNRAPPRRCWCRRHYGRGQSRAGGAAILSGTQSKAPHRWQIDRESKPCPVTRFLPRAITWTAPRTEPLQLELGRRRVMSILLRSALAGLRRRRRCFRPSQLRRRPPSVAACGKPASRWRHGHRPPSCELARTSGAVRLLACPIPTRRARKAAAPR